MDREQLNQALAAAETAARAGREVVMHYFGQITNVREKNQSGIVCEDDVEI
jgi:hypothetical protein